MAQRLGEPPRWQPGHRSNWKNHKAFRLSQMPFGGEPGRDGFVGYSTPRKLNDRTYAVVWLALSLDPIDHRHAST